MNIFGGEAQALGLLSLKLLLMASPSNLIIIKTIVTLSLQNTSPWDISHLDQTRCTNSRAISMHRRTPLSSILC